MAVGSLTQALLFRFQFDFPPNHKSLHSSRNSSRLKSVCKCPEKIYQIGSIIYEQICAYHFPGKSSVFFNCCSSIPSNWKQIRKVRKNLMIQFIITPRQFHTPKKQTIRVHWKMYRTLFLNDVWREKSSLYTIKMKQNKKQIRINTWKKLKICGITEKLLENKRFLLSTHSIFINISEWAVLIY